MLSLLIEIVVAILILWLARYLIAAAALPGWLFVAVLVLVVVVLIYRWVPAIQRTKLP